MKFAYPREIKEPGGTVLYGVEVINTSDIESVTIDNLDDDLYGDVFTLGTICPAFAGVTFAPTERFFCIFRESVPPPASAPGEPGDVITDVITATGTAGATMVTASDDATVVIIDSPSSLEVTKRAFPQEREEARRVWVDTRGGRVSELVAGGRDIDLMRLDDSFGMDAEAAWKKRVSTKE